MKVKIEDIEYEVITQEDGFFLNNNFIGYEYIYGIFTFSITTWFEIPFVIVLVSVGFFLSIWISFFILLFYSVYFFYLNKVTLKTEVGPLLLKFYSIKDKKDFLRNFKLKSKRFKKHYKSDK